MTERDRWGSRETDAQDPNYGRSCGRCKAPVRAGEKWLHLTCRDPLGPPGAMVCKLAWVEERALEIRQLRARAYEGPGWHGSASVDTSYAARDVARQRIVEESNAKEATLHAAIVGAIAYGVCEPDEVSVCRAACHLSPEPKTP